MKTEVTTQNIIDPQDALAVAAVLRAENDADFPLQNPISPKEIAATEPRLDSSDAGKYASVRNGSDMSW